MKYLLIIALFINPLARADQVQAINKGEPAPFQGFIMDRERADAIRNNDLDKQYTGKENGYLKKDNELLNQRVNLAQTQIDSLSKQVVEGKDNFWTKAGFFILGAAVTTGLAFGVSRATR